MGDVAIDGLVEITGPVGLESSIVLPKWVMYGGGKLQWRNIIAPGLGALLPAIDKPNETGLAPFRFNPDNGALWVDNTASKILAKKSGKFSGSTSVTVSNELIANTFVTKSIYLSYASYQCSQEAEIWFSYGPASANLGTGMASPTSAAFLRNLAPAKGIIAKDFGDSRVLRGNTQTSLWLNVAAATPAADVIWNVFYTLEDEFYG